MNIFKNAVIDAIAEIIEFDKERIESLIETPPNPEMGDFAFPCFQLSKVMRKAPNIIAEELKEKISKPASIERVENAGGYLNFYVDKSLLIESVINEIISKGNLYGSSMRGEGKRALIEHTSINPNASPHLGRARNALIGDSIVRLHKFEGYDVDVHYFVNDVGKQIAMLLLGASEKSNVTFDDLLDIYVEINARVKDDPELEKQVFELLNKLENGDENTIKDFRNIVNTCINGQSDILGQLGIKYDYYDFESDYVLGKVTDRIIEQLKETKKLFEDNDGRFVLNFEDEGLNFMVVTRKDKTSLYPLRDIAYTIDKANVGAERNILVLGEDQKLYFKQVKTAVSLLGYQSPEIVHYAFVLLTEGKMSTRNGTVILLEDFMKEAVAKAKEEMAKRHDNVNEEIAKSIAYGAVKYAILKASNEKNVIFDWDNALSFEGDSSPYLQYSFARINSIFRKFGQEVPSELNLKLLNTNIEFELVKELSNFPNIIAWMFSELSPHIIASYVYGVTKKFSAFYHECPILNAETDELRNARLALAFCVRQVIKNCFDILGIDPVEYM